jgi:hypothetical protein
MLDKLKLWLHTVLHLVAALIVATLVAGHILTAGIITTGVVNAWRLDSYITPATGVGIVLLVFMVVWAPLWFLKRMDP